MSVTDPIADMLTRIRNAILARHEYTLVPASRIKIAIARILKEEGFVKDFEITKDSPQKMLKVYLSYTGKKEPVLTGLRRVSKPGLRVYAKSSEMPRVLGGLGVAIVSTPRGIMTAQQARRLNVGGEVLCYIW
ncbi:MAG: 30S ribosomal protein S8 [Chloroflexi bacterium]|nr:30S ribosomal protein S8 [Chloroflexota bacterium]MDA8189118.1 30S ribosomal protein S8 [Dehalococcoidales bacterium]